MYKIKEEQKRQGWSLVVHAWTIACIASPALARSVSTNTASGAASTAYCHAPCGPPPGSQLSNAER